MSTCALAAIVRLLKKIADAGLECLDFVGEADDILTDYFIGWDHAKGGIPLLDYFIYLIQVLRSSAYVDFCFRLAELAQTSISYVVRLVKNLTWSTTSKDTEASPSFAPASIHPPQTHKSFSDSTSATPPSRCSRIKAKLTTLARRVKMPVHVQWSGNRYVRVTDPARVCPAHRRAVLRALDSRTGENIAATLAARFIGLGNIKKGGLANKIKIPHFSPTNKISSMFRRI
ncbi:hypothetical protein BOTBODRAFT_548130 [Botryobasidium botryosum FD-172 SS1]|uniref:Uncharacterized protein n=1 Tax=Botryobasidium botryosum (strain FD-172 SS1) TaxID=930990 RepID=A0A067N1L1_BOTB1|nr:hypothetical protein BOTBODRAFT_548130 [Botryobasidium botryosum FD-172 SS1]